MSICWRSTKPYLIERWSSGCHNAAQLWREIAQQGLPAKMTTVRSFAAQLRRDHTYRHAVSMFRVREETEVRK